MPALFVRGAGGGEQEIPLFASAEASPLIIFQRRAEGTKVRVVSTRSLELFIRPPFDLERVSLLLLLHRLPENKEFLDQIRGW